MIFFSALISTSVLGAWGTTDWWGGVEREVRSQGSGGGRGECTGATREGRGTPCPGVRRGSAGHSLGCSGARQRSQVGTGIIGRNNARNSKEMANIDKN